VKFVSKLIDLLAVGDVASVVSLCDAMLPPKERTPIRVDIQQLLLYRADLAARSSVKCPVDHFSELLYSLKILCCVAHLCLFRHEARRIKRERFLRAPQ
jgi:hypothetical protein